MTSDTPKSKTNETPTSEAFASEVGCLLAGRHCEDVVVLNVNGLSQVCDCVVIATGTSDRQMKSVASEVSTLGKESNFPAFRKSVDSDATWIVIDFISVVVHLFEPQRRAYYDLEDLWSDAKRIDVPSESATK